MKKIKFNKIIIKNFRNIVDLEINFNDEITEINGKNGVGKTNTLSAIMWCLFGKNIEDVKQFPISPIIDGKEDNSIQTTVKIIINDNYVVERTYNKRVVNLKTGWIIDGKEELVAITQSNYVEELKENLIDEETFKSLSNINYIPNLHWKDLKELIFDLIGEIKDEEVLLKDNFDSIEEYIKKFGIEQTQKLVQETEKTLNEEIKRLETQHQTLINTKEKYVVENEEAESLKLKKKQIEDKLYEYQEQNKKVDEEYSKYYNLKNEIDSLGQKKKSIESQIEFTNKNILDYEELYKNNSYNVEETRNKDLFIVNNTIEEKNVSLKNAKSTKELLEKDLLSVKEEGNDLKQKEIKVENNTCSACGQKLPDEMINQTLNKLKNQQFEKLVELKNKFEEIKKEIAEKDQIIKDIENDVNVLEQRKEEIKTRKYEKVAETEKQKQIRIAKEQKELDVKNYEKLIVEINQELKAKELIFDKLSIPNQESMDLKPFRDELNEINDKLATTIALEKINDDIKNIYNDLQNKRDNKIKNKEKMQMIIKFNNIKAELLKEKVRFYFDLVNFKTKDFTQSGEEVETFKLTNDKGVEWKDINTGNKILLGIDLLQGIMKAKDVYVPIIIDNFESLTTKININNTQLIVASAIKNIDKLEVK